MYKEARIVAKILLLVAIVLCVFAQILPLGKLSSEKFGGTLSYYTWGYHVIPTSFDLFGGFSNPGATWGIYYEPEFFEIIFSIPEAGGFAFAYILLCLVLPSSLIALGIGIYAYGFLDKKFSYTPIYAAVFSIVSLAFFVIFFNLGMFSIPELSMLYQFFNYSYGFILMIISIILFFIVFGLQYIIPYPVLFAPTPTSKPIPQQTTQSAQTTSADSNVVNYCPNCGSVTGPMSIFCYKCGYKLR